MGISHGSRLKLWMALALTGSAAAAWAAATWPGRARAGRQEAPAELRELLPKAAAYCRLLEGAVLDFVCREEIEETIHNDLENRRPARATRIGGGSYIVRDGDPPRTVKNALVYDYQYMRKRGELRETRTLLSENGRRRNEREAPLKTTVGVWRNILQGPVVLFGEAVQPYCDYSLAGRDEIDGRGVLIVEAVPKPDAPETGNLYGKAWIVPETAEILRIEWSPKSVIRFEVFEKRAKSYKRTPRLILRSEFSVEKNGLRFPSRLSVEEAYLDDEGQAFVRSETAVAYKDFRFFTVEVEVK